VRTRRLYGKIKDGAVYVQEGFVCGKLRPDLVEIASVTPEGLVANPMFDADQAKALVTALRRFIRAAKEQA
jgi:hypothetical protein